MALKVFQPLTTPTTSNEQVGVGQATVSASGAFQSRGIGAAANRALFVLNCSAASGTTPSLTVTVQGNDPQSGKWIDIASFDPVTGVTASPLTLEVNPYYFQKCRISYEVSGTTPSFTFSCGAFFMSDESVA